MNHSQNQQNHVKPAPKSSFSKKRWAIAVVVVVCLVGGVAAAWFINSRSEPASTPEASKKQEATKRNEQVTQIASQAQQEAGQGNFEKAKETYDTAIKAAPDSTQKSQLLYNKATLLHNGADQEAAFNAAKEADATQSSRATVDLLAQMYNARGDTQNALVYYQKALSMVDKNSAQAERDIKRYQAVITALGGPKG